MRIVRWVCEASGEFYGLVRFYAQLFDEPASVILDQAVYFVLVVPEIGLTQFWVIYVLNNILKFD